MESTTVTLQTRWPPSADGTSTSYPPHQPVGRAIQISSTSTNAKSTCTAVCTTSSCRSFRLASVEIGPGSWMVIGSYTWLLTSKCPRDERHQKSPML